MYYKNRFYLLLRKIHSYVWVEINLPQVVCIFFPMSKNATFYYFCIYLYKLLLYYISTQKTLKKFWIPTITLSITLFDLNLWKKKIFAGLKKNYFLFLLCVFIIRCEFQQHCTTCTHSQTRQQKNVSSFSAPINYD